MKILKLWLSNQHGLLSDREVVYKDHKIVRETLDIIFYCVHAESRV